MASQNRLILGTMTIGPDIDAGARITSIDEYKKCLDYLASKGYNEIDTAAVYVAGKQESFTKEAGFKEKGFSVASKIMPVKLGAHSAQELPASWDVSLQKLGVDSTDIFYLHAPDRSVDYEETLEAVDGMHRAGKFKRLGLSNYPAWEVAEIVGICERRGFVKPTVYQGMYNAITRAIESELIPCLRKFGIDLIIYNPLAAGLFSGKYTSLEQPAEGRFSSTSALGKMYMSRYFKQSTMDALAIVEPVARKHDIPLIEVGLRWCIHHSKLQPRSKGGNDGLIIGISSYGQLEQNIQACEKGSLPDEVVEALDRAWDTARGDAPTYLR
ncbi:aflatoxin B1 aldehyde reductase member 2 [Stachybotrys elegans]|uniref:Aflatoxin B1 aldehyde reductase member 2 n=1 Tax=Stachybotrys elegans TaxID=80388 RepID=A0A8K0WNP2_9HYPO|nr:aflatoxin B1 aldehyde reductase member 2 [Stachybotrys elegans]